MAMSKNINFEAINKLDNGYDRDDFGKKLNKKLAAKHKQRDYYRSKINEA